MTSIDLNSDRRPYIVFFGVGDDGSRFAQRLRPFLDDFDLKLHVVDDAERLMDLAADAVLIFVALSGIRKGSCDFVHQLHLDRTVVADIVALSDQSDEDERFWVLSQGFDACFDTSCLDIPEFRDVFLRLVDKGFSRLENRVQQEEYHTLKAFLAASPEAFIIFDGQRRLFAVSDHYYSAYPKSASRLVRGIDVMDAFALCVAESGIGKDDPRYHAMEAFWLRMEGNVEFELDDGRIWEIRAKSLPGGQGTIVTTSDVTRYRQQQRDLELGAQKIQDALDKEREASSLQKQFISMISHEFRTPLSIIDGNAQILFRRADALEPDVIKRRSKTIRNAVSRLVNMMEGVLSSSMLRTGNLELSPEPVNLRALISELCEEYADLASTHEIVRDVDQLPDIVMLDRKVMTLVIGNLLSNAIKFTREKPQIFIKGRVADGEIVIQIQDNGIGISPNELSRIFDKFYRTPEASGIPGTGIGLSLVRDLVQLQGGHISVRSDAGYGTVFTIVLPLLT